MTGSNANARLEVFCDGVFAIALTLLIIDIKIPPGIENSADLWRALAGIGRPLMAFTLSFIVIFISWANHHSIMLLLNKTSGPFIYANGLLLFSIVVLPFPTSLLGGHVFTSHAAPAVMLYNAVMALQGLAWIFMSEAAFQGGLTKNAASQAVMAANRSHPYFGLALYSALAILAAWIPTAVMVITMMTWLFWLGFGFYLLGKARTESA
jgi:uncharacterized membrane protein